MKRFVFVFCVIVLVEMDGTMSQRRDQGNCGENANFSEKPYTCEYLCTEQGVELECKYGSKPGCECNFNTYYNKRTQTCMDIDCQNLDCVGKQNEAFYSCESGSRESCGCGKFVTLDCRTGCQCKNGFCRENGVCVRRKCSGSPFD